MGDAIHVDPVGPASTAPPRAPWFYRQRFIVFGALYGVVFFVGYLIAGALGVASMPTYRLVNPPALLAAVALVLALGAFALRVWASSYLTSTIVRTHDPQSPELRVSGPYRFTRNPLYLGNIMGAIALGLVTPWPAAILIVVAMVVYNGALIAIEEPFLTATEGDAYAQYLKTV